MASVDEAIELIPRAYQEEIFEYARGANVIAALDTGSGKTFIAALLIKWSLAQPEAAGKKAIFLVPKVPLVDQQRDFLAAQTPLSVRGYKGAMGVDGWDRNRWQAEFAQTDCLVMTAQIFKNVLTHAYWSMEQVSLLVFDECHHTQQNHPYNMIMTDHYAICKKKPKIFGMTASPIWNPKNPRLSIQMLQFNLFARVMAVREHSEQLDRHANKPIEVILKYPSPPPFYPTYHSPSLWDSLAAQDLLEIPRLYAKTLRIRYDVTLNALGPAGADYFLVYNLSDAVEEYLRHSYEQSLRSSHVTGSSEYGGASTGAKARKARIRGQNADKVEKLRISISTFDARLSADNLPCDWLSPKLRALINVLVEHRCDDFQGIIFVDQRQVASVLSWVLHHVAETKDWIRCGGLTGHGEATNGENLKGMSVSAQKEIVKLFRTGELNLLVATSVAEEGLDFPACKLVIRFDPIQHMVGYVQSRGRARQHKSTYVIMVQENDAMQLARYEDFRNVEPSLKKVYQSMNAPNTSATEDDQGNERDNEQDDPRDLAARENYVVPSTGATLTYSSAIIILDHLCALIPRDAYTSSQQPKYTGEYQVTVRLPRALPLAASELVYVGMEKRSKKEAKRAAAFIAVRALHGLGVLDDHLSPAKAKKGEVIEDADGRPIAKINAVATMMDVLVASPWKAGPPWYMYPVSLDGQTPVGLIAGNVLPEVELCVRGMRVQLHCYGTPQRLELDQPCLDLLERFTKIGIWWGVTPSPVTSTPGCFLVPLNADGAIECEMMKEAVANEIGTYDWSTITERDEGHLVLMNVRRFGRPLLLKKFRLDLSLDTKPQLEESEGDFDTYAEYFAHKYPDYLSKNSSTALPRPPKGPILEVTAFPRHSSTSHTHRNSGVRAAAEVLSESKRTILLPQSFCRRVTLPMHVIRAFHVFAPLCRRISDVFRARTAQKILGLPPIPDDLMVEALTLPCADGGLNNQRLETMGDSVLKLSVVTYVYNRFPHKHEGQLSTLKGNSVSNRLLLARAREVQLERFLTSEQHDARAWQTVLAPPASTGVYIAGSEEIPFVRRVFPRRSLQDCMEASLGASYIAGGIDLALRTGTVLGLCFGGDVPWPKRYPALKKAPPAALFNGLQKDLQYEFRNGHILVEAVKHASFDSNDGSCYQRLEFLGDAVLELVVTTFLFKKFPEAKSGQLTSMRARLICNAALSALAVKRLSLHKYLLANNVGLSKEIAREVDILSSASYEDIVINDWKYDPPKVLGDIFESVLGAIFVDNRFDYARVAPIVEHIMEDMLSIPGPDMPHDPVTQLLQWTAKSGCVKAKFQRMRSDPLVERKDGIAVLVHDQIVAGPICAQNKQLSKGLVSEEARAVLSDETSEFWLQRICTCMHAEESDAEDDLPLRDIRERDLDHGTETGFALAGRIRLEEVTRDEHFREKEERDDDEFGEDERDEDERLDELERQEVEMLLSLSFEMDGEFYFPVNFDMQTSDRRPDSDFL
ncbi:hypothetical protein M0805_001548 [Coniferiporia weirii]|nr:hypothetical protein M0805_001548 [Coniferiporia weirii]